MLVFEADKKILLERRLQEEREREGGREKKKKKKKKTKRSKKSEMGGTVDELKAEGNGYFKAGKFQEAIDAFTAALELDDKNHVLYSNRSAAKASLRDFAAACDDARNCVKLMPTWAKGYSRLGAALFGLGELEESKKIYEQGLAIEPENATLLQGRSDVDKAIQGKAAFAAKAAEAGARPNPIKALFSDPSLVAKLAAHPKTRNYFAQPDFMQMLGEVQKDSDKLGAYMSDQRMMDVLGVAMGVDISATGAGGAGAQNGGNASPAAEEASSPPPTAKADDAATAASSKDTKMEEEEPQEETDKTKAQAAKKRGNEAYKSRRFDEAISCYDEALALDDSDISFITNKAAVRYEMGEYEACIADCDAALEKAREIRSEFTQVARALSRKGTALKKMGKLREALECFQKSLTEHRTADTLKKLGECEKELKRQEEEAYLDPALAEAEREKGNTLFKEGKFPDAIKCYTESIRRGPKDPRVWSNRAACYTKLTALPEALKDAEKAIEIDPNFVKAYTRKGHAQFFMKEYEKAMATYQQGLDKDPNNEELKNAMMRCVEQINRLNRGEASAEELAQRQQKAMADPEIQTILSDPIMRQVLNDFQENPRAAQKHLENAHIAANINKLVAAGIIQVR